MIVTRLTHLSRVIMGAYVIGASAVLFSTATLAVDEPESAIIKEVMKSAIYEYVGKGPLTLDDHVEVYLKDEFDDHPKRSLFFVNEDGSHGYRSRCSGSGCDTWGDPEFVRQKCEEKYRKCFLYKVGVNYLWDGISVPGAFRDKVVWDFRGKKARIESERLLKEEEKRKAEEEERRKAEEDKARIAKIARLEQALAERSQADQAGGDISRLALGGIEFGNYHALVIGINNYKNLPKLKTAVNDAKAVARVLTKDYGFKVTLLLDADRGDIVEALDEYRETLGPKDNLLIYYAGHGWLDDEADRGYWLPANAKPKRRTNWVSNATITDTLKVLSAKHVMVVADSCYSGTLVRSANVAPRTRAGDYWRRMAAKWARVAITSGGLEPVADKGGGKNSPFAKAFIQALKANPAIMDGTELFQALRRPVMVAAQQTPEYSDVRNAGHDGGDFIFVRKR